ncbi:minor tail protein [Xanthomonas phage XAJ2]|uniref:Minor tail protein n=1 Tax=Xanthomonas phage XAJ2 TaxID=1775249 RepID=A0A1I9L2E4_9CAUD|nr:minor tail protein [Xanthomonas phage XAJ2]
MILSYEHAVNEILKLFLDKWNSETAAIAGYVPKVYWPGVQVASAPDPLKFWCRVTIKTVQEPQTGFSACIEEDGTQSKSASRFTASGLVFVQLFCPKNHPDSMLIGRRLAQTAKLAFRAKKTPNGVWFPEVTATELDSEELYNRFNIVAETQYDEAA